MALTKEELEEDRAFKKYKRAFRDDPREVNAETRRLRTQYYAAMSKREAAERKSHGL